MAGSGRGNEVIGVTWGQAFPTVPSEHQRQSEGSAVVRPRSPMGPEAQTSH